VQACSTIDAGLPRHRLPNLSSISHRRGATADAPCTHLRLDLAAVVAHVQERRDRVGHLHASGAYNWCARAHCRYIIIVGPSRPRPEQRLAQQEHLQPQPMPAHQLWSSCPAQAPTLVCAFLMSHAASAPGAAHAQASAASHAQGVPGWVRWAPAASAWGGGGRRAWLVGAQVRSSVESRPLSPSCPSQHPTPQVWAKQF